MVLPISPPKNPGCLIYGIGMPHTHFGGDSPTHWVALSISQLVGVLVRDNLKLHRMMVQRYPNLKEEVSGSNLCCEISSLPDRNLSGGQLPPAL